jgi:hypothetical protein
MKFVSDGDAFTGEHRVLGIFNARVECMRPVSDVFRSRAAKFDGFLFRADEQFWE